MYGSYWGLRAELEGQALRQRKAHLTSVRSRLKLQERVKRLEDELEWVRLVSSALMGVCIEKGLVTPDELKERLQKLDLADGVEDGKVGPGASPPAPPPAPLPIVRRRRFRPRD